MRKDPQKRRVYEWQYEWTDWNRRTLSWRKTRQLVKAACKVFDVPPPTIRKMHGDYSYAEGVHIGIIKEHQNVGVALHEAAHYITRILAGKGNVHGPVFMGVWLTLLIHFKVAPRDALEASLRKRKIKWRKVKKTRRKAG